MCTARRIDLDETEWTGADKKSFDSPTKEVHLRRKSRRARSAVDAHNDPQFSPSFRPRIGPLKLGKPKGSAIADAQDGTIEKRREPPPSRPWRTSREWLTSHFANFEIARRPPAEDLLRAFFSTIAVDLVVRRWRRRAPPAARGARMPTVQSSGDVFSTNTFANVYSEMLLAGLSSTTRRLGDSASAHGSTRSGSSTTASAAASEVAARSAR
jgi:hypothetical protein